ncbi:Dps family protein [Kribbella sp. NPDC059898]|uniref:Dps family protein n=1 Tax=Kribbella sp. NPDC059898 TaxID=3346995 RepID=UPI003646A5D8
MIEIRSDLSVDEQKQTVEALQSALVDLVDFTLTGKQAHWNVVGPHFRSIHLQLDELVAAARKHTDVVAERIVALGGNPDGRAETVARHRSTGELQPGYLPGVKAVEAIVDRLAVVISGMREDMRATEAPDPVSQDLLNDALHDLEEQSWMFQAMLQPET